MFVQKKKAQSKQLKAVYHPARAKQFSPPQLLECVDSTCFQTIPLW